MNGKLRISSNVSYMREWHSGLFHINNAYWGVYPSAYLGFGKYWALNVNYTYSSGKGYMRGSSNLTRFSDNLKCGVQYSKGNLFAKLQVNSLFLKKVIPRLGLFLTILVVIHIRADHGIDDICLFPLAILLIMERR